MVSRIMAASKPRKGLGPKDDWGGYGSKQSYTNAIKSGQVQLQQGAVGNWRAAAGKAVAQVIKSPVGRPLRQAVTKIGDYAAGSVGAGAPRGASTAGKIVKVAKKADVYTPQGVYKGADVFIKKPSLTEKQIAGITKAAQTKADNAYKALAQAGRVGGAIGLGAGAAGTLGAQQAVKAVKNLVSPPNNGGKRKGGRGGGAKKR